MNQLINKDIHTEFKDIINLHYKKFYKHACIQVGDKESAKDIVQETFLSAYKSLSTFKGKSSMETWIFGILNHKISMYFREKNIEKKMIQENLEEKLFKRGGQWKEEWISSNSEEAIINFLKFCINKLKDQSKQVLLLRFYQNKKTEEICTICNITKDNLWQILHRSKLQLKVCIQSKLKVTND
ncbi:sigma-70 family RNA polymerase sigma factor [Schleiferia thermophila]|jgi:RNA polymerase sigma-70 factor (ECF subfamily)|uniref:RNA polymerase sigma-70 factor (ECF subfamily) n=1 Tax=Schleiferia thermophila TaxID=884107 RepID=A0A369A2R3_9FLAO|nr:sigma-70 family RNA polymerase sigma factor [Schleiferia thermophila]KFD38544.1 hypothetical protein AT05_09700 [Schleiferia thermophila str. Yellowstone]PMB22743.1 hypothetical protein CEN47_19485 [Fischerella thermalis CCMEE 5319]RCX03610.1 RNA polymerase sigma-70 factor (ECF subfamily) [Schleiferia thermophila]GCD79845.1 RNA polymerase sigma factor [Schleiferia thermophila]